MNTSALFLYKLTTYLLQLLELSLLELLESVCVFCLNVKQARVTQLVTHFPDIQQRWTQRLQDIFLNVYMIAQKILRILIYTKMVAYLTDDKQPVFEKVSGLIDLLGADFGAPHVERFPLLEAGEEGNASYLLVVGVLLFPAVQGHVFILVVAHRQSAIAADHQVVIFVISVNLYSGRRVQVPATLDGERPSGRTRGRRHIAGQLTSDGEIEATLK